MFCVVLVAALTLFGWVTANDNLKALLPAPDASPMKVNTAVALLLIAGSMLLQQRRHKLDAARPALPQQPLSTRLVAADLCSFAACILAALTLSQHLFGWDLAIDQMLIADPSPAPNKMPGRMSVATASCLGMMGMASLLARRFPLTSDLAAAAAGTIAYLGLCTYLFGVDALKPVTWFSTMAIHTAGSLVLLSGAHFTARPHGRPGRLLSSPYVGGTIARRVLPATFATAPALGAIIVLGGHANLYGAEFALALFATASVVLLTIFIWWYAGHLNTADHMRRRLELDRESLLLREQSARERAESASRAKDQFLSVVSHELRTPLTPALLLARSLEQRGDLPAEVISDLATIREQITVEAQLISNLLDLARTQTGKLTLNTDTGDLREFLKSTINLIKPTFTQGGVELTCAFPPHPVMACFDTQRIGQVLRNLLDNAAKFTPSGGSVSVRLDCPDGSSDARITVSDTGIGIAPDRLDTIFSAFTQADASIPRRFGGLGIGLTIARDITLAHGGSLTATSQGVGAGTTFCLKLPRVPTVLPASQLPSQPTIPPAQSQRRAHEPANEPPGHDAHLTTPSRAANPPLQLLVVEDSPPTLKALTRLLRLQGYQVTAATSAAEALEAAANSSIDVVISDIGLPDMDGWQLMQALRSSHPKIKGVAMSGYVSTEDAARSAQAGFALHLPKPLEISNLYSTLNTLERL